MYVPMDRNKILNNPSLTSAVLGVTKKEFESLIVTFKQVLLEHREQGKRKRVVGGGSKGNIKSAEQKLFYILFYIKTYPTFDVAAFVFASSKSRTHRWTHDILPLLEKTLKRKVVLPKRRISSPEEFLTLYPEVKEVLLDGLERPMQRPKSKKTQKKHYSGKKKRHTRKNIVVTDEKKRILVLTPSKNGKVHDKKMSDNNYLMNNIPPTVAVLADTGFLGIQKQHPRVLMPKKKPRGGKLTIEDKAMNRLISSVRIYVEHAIGGMKRFRCVADVYRNKNGIDDCFMNVAAGLWNHKLQMK